MSERGDRSLGPLAFCGAGSGLVAVCGHDGLEPRQESLQMLGVVSMPVDRAIVELLGDLRVARKERMPAILVEAEAARFELQAEIVEQPAGRVGLMLHERFVPEHVLVERELPAIVL